MLDLPDDLSQLLILERLAEIILRDIRIKISQGRAAMPPVRARREVQWVLSYLRQGGRPSRTAST